MKLLLSALSAVPEFRSLLAALDGGACPAAVSGLSPVHRAHMSAAVREATGRPVAVLCADDAECRRMAADLRAFSGEEVFTLPAREFLFHNAAVVSRQWEQRRLEVLWALTEGRVPFLVASAEAMLQRTLPPDCLARSARVLKMGAVCDLGELAEALTAAGYRRCDQVEGVGQFALRGGILDFFSPAHPQPVRVEFFGDEPDSMGLFDPSTQRRTRQLEECCILPAAEVLPHLAPGGLPGLVRTLKKKRDGARRRGGPDGLVPTLDEDVEKLENGVLFPAVDRYLALIYPQMATAADYLPPDAAVFLSESPRFAERGKNYLWQLNEDVAALSENGTLLAELGVYARTPEELSARLSDWPVAYLDSFPSSQYPQRPRTLLTVTAKQLPSYGVSLETAVSDLSHYLSAGYSAVVLAGTEQRCLNLQSLLREQKLRAGVDFQLHALPEPGKAVIACGGLSSGMEYPGAKLPSSPRGRPSAGEEAQAQGRHQPAEAQVLRRPLGGGPGGP